MAAALPLPSAASAAAAAAAGGRSPPTGSAPLDADVVPCPLSALHGLQALWTGIMPFHKNSVNLHMGQMPQSDTWPRVSRAAGAPKLPGQPNPLSSRPAVLIALPPPC